jgi:hypothetical protein
MLRSSLEMSHVINLVKLIFLDEIVFIVDLFNIGTISHSKERLSGVLDW